MRESEVRTQVSGARSAAKEVGSDVERGKADAADGAAIAGLQLLRRVLGLNDDAAVFALLLDAGDAADFFDDSSEHKRLRGWRKEIMPKEIIDGRPNGTCDLRHTTGADMPLSKDYFKWSHACWPTRTPRQPEAGGRGAPEPPPKIPYPLPRVSS